MKVVITGGAGFLGKKLARRILQQGAIAGPAGTAERVSELLLFDVAKAAGPGLDDPRVKTLAGGIANFATVQSIGQGAAPARVCGGGKYGGLPRPASCPWDRRAPAPPPGRHRTAAVRSPARPYRRAPRSRPAAGCALPASCREGPHRR